MILITYGVLVSQLWMSHKKSILGGPRVRPMTLRTLDGDRDALQRLVEKMFDREEEGYK